MLAQARQLPQTLGTRFPLGSPEWLEIRKCFCLTGQEVVILGYGAIATRLVELLAPFQMKITAMRRKARGNETVKIVELEDLPAALKTADHVINILPDNKESHHFISAERLNQMKPGALFYNIGRGATVDQTALAECLHSGQVAAAWLDVTEPEPLPEGHVLLSAPNCFITPHFGGCHTHDAKTMAQHFLGNLSCFLGKTPLKDRIM
jgi:phosphoglycerate dehydrogenase-like enzyme